MDIPALRIQERCNSYNNPKTALSQTAIHKQRALPPLQPINRMNHLATMQNPGHHHLRQTVMLTITNLKRALKTASPTMIQQLMAQGHEKNKMKIKMPIRKKHQSKPKPRKPQLIRRIHKTVTAAPQSPTPPPLFCFFLLFLCGCCCGGGRVRVSEREPCTARTHTRLSLTLCVCPLAWTLALTSSHEAHT
ncbi:hypothetical protein TcCL_Unassigned04442 [Trypanosoma cruzi]|nr:hypothetical protein TcCL_Unassigned04442 [Trypanosoma cruzi]